MKITEKKLRKVIREFISKNSVPYQDRMHAYDYDDLNNPEGRWTVKVTGIPKEAERAFNKTFDTRDEARGYYDELIKIIERGYRHAFRGKATIYLIDDETGEAEQRHVTKDMW